MATPRKKRPDTPPSREMSTEGMPQVYGEMLTTMINDLQELVAWWQDRKATLLRASDASRKTERMTFHIERRWIEAIRRQADLDHLTITEMINTIFQHHFEGN